MSIKSEVNFAIKFLNKLEVSNESTIAFSPASILTSLAIIYAGSDRLSNQFCKILGEEIDSTNLLKHYSKFVKYCQTSSNLNNDNFKILLSNRFFLSSKKPLHQTFVKVVSAEFSSNSLEQIDFSIMDMPKNKVAKEKNAKKLCEKINSFANEETAGKIRDVIKVEEVNSAMNILISNALCIVGNWEEPFNDPIPCPFYSSPTSQKTIPMLSKNISPGGCILAKGNNWKCIGLPYKTRNVWLHILLPNRKDDLPYILEKLSYSFIKRCIKSAANVDVVRVSIPAFEIEESKEISNNLGRSGLTLIFQNEGINLMFENDQVNLDKIFHKVLINIDKHGSFGCENSSPSNSSCLPPSDVTISNDDAGESFIADHPFLFFINSVKNQNPEKMKNILFMGTFC